MGNKLDYPI